MTLGDISSKITSLTTADTNQYTNAERLIDLNLWQQKIVSMILDSQDESDWDDQNRQDYPRKTQLLTTNRDYPISVNDKVLKIKSLSVAYDGTNFYRATPLEFSSTDIADSTAADTTQNTTIDAQFPRTAPRYDIKFNALFLYPKATSSDVAGGGLMIVEWFRQAIEFTLNDLTMGTYIPGFDDTFHAMLAYGPAYEYCEAKGLPQADRIYKELQVYEERLRRQYSSKQLDRKYMLTGDYQNNK